MLRWITWIALRGESAIILASRIAMKCFVPEKVYTSSARAAALREV